MHRLEISFALLGALCLGACGERKAVEPVTTLPPVALDEHVAWVDTENERVLLLDVGSRPLEAQTTHHDLPNGPLSVVRRRGANELLVLCAGKSDEAGTLSVVGPDGVDRDYELGASFDRLIQSDDGRYAFLLFSSNGGKSGSLLFNPNEVAIIDLDVKGKEAITARTLRSFGAMPNQVVFSPLMDIAGEERRLAVVLFGSQITLLDLAHQDRPEITIELSQDQIQLNHVEFSAEESRIYLLGANSQDIYVVNLFAASENWTNDFQPSLNQLGAGALPTDMAVYGDGDSRRLLSLSKQHALVIESSSNRVTDIPLKNPADKILMYEGTSPFDNNVEPRALLYGLNASAVTFLDLNEVEERKSRNLEEVRLGGTVTATTELGNGKLLLVFQNQGLAVLDLESRTPSRISAQLPLNSAVPDLDAERIWVAPPGSTALGFLTLDHFQTGQVNLDDPIEQLLLVSSGKRKLAVVTHPSFGGKVTVLNANDPRNVDDTLTLDGFFFSDFQER